MPRNLCKLEIDFSFYNLARRVGLARKPLCLLGKIYLGQNSLLGGGRIPIGFISLQGVGQPTLAQPGGHLQLSSGTKHHGRAGPSKHSTIFSQDPLKAVYDDAVNLVGVGMTPSEKV